MDEMAFAPRSLLFVPGGRPDRVAKAVAMGADAVVVDLEDAVAPQAKDAARESALAAVAGLGRRASTVLVRINPPGTPWYREDLRAAAGAGVDGVVLPKYEDPEQLVALRAALPAAALVVVGIETVRGVADCRPLLAAGPSAAYFGAEDLVADLGGRRSAGGDEVLHARSRVVLFARLAGIGALDQAVVAVRDGERFRSDADQGRDLGYQGKICLHPQQVGLAHEVFTPSAAEVEHARAVLSVGADGVGVVDGRMVDAVHLRIARGVLRRAAAGEGGCRADR